MREKTNPAELAHIGKGERRLEAVAKVTGDAVFTSDMAFPGMLYAQVKKSPHARARILRIDASKAQALPGVRAVLLGSELNYKLGLYVVDKDILAKNEVRHYGEAVAGVAADTPEIAREAADLIHVEYEVLPPVLNTWMPSSPTLPSCTPTWGNTTTFLSSALRRTPISPTFRVSEKATWERASPILSGSSSANT